MTEIELVQGCLKEKRSYQKALFDKYAPKMLSVCKRYARHSMEAEDLLQDAFVRIFDKLGTFRGDGSLEGWIRRIVVHACIRNYRKSSFKKEQFGLESLPEEPVEAEAVDRLGVEELLKMISGLPDGYRMVFNLFAIEGYSHAEVAEMIGCGESTSRSQLAKARKMLQSMVVETEIVRL